MMNTGFSRRKFLGTVGLAFLGLRDYALAEESGRVIAPFGPLKNDPQGLLDLPEGFTYRVISKRGDVMDDGFLVPGIPDGMACFEGTDGKLVLVRNHEISSNDSRNSPFSKDRRPASDVPDALFYDRGEDGSSPFFGGTSNVVFDPVKGEKTAEFLSLIGTDRNCAGGPMPWGTWVTCEEPADMTSEAGRRHGWCFEVKATEEMGLQQPVPLKALGRFRHEAVALDPKTGILYLTEDRNDGLLYRFIPKVKNQLAEGRLQALVVKGQPGADLRNYDAKLKQIAERSPMEVEWMDLEDTDAPDDDLRFRGYQAGAARFARGEGIHHTPEGIFICCTDGGPKNLGQIFRLVPGDAGGGDSLELFIQPDKSDLLTNGDNLCPAPWGGVVVCEDLVNKKFASSVNVRCVTSKGEIFTIARNAKNQSEFAGCCFSPDGKWLFVNMQGLGLTLAITGDWEKAVG